MLHRALPCGRRQRLLARLALSAILGLPAMGSAEERAEQGGVQLRDPLNDEPLTLDYRPDQAITDAVERFHQTGDNPYTGDEDAIRAGRQIYNSQCQACHMPDGSGRIGPSLIDGESGKYPRVGTDVGDFEIIYAGGAGAMQAFGKRMDQDDILKVMAYVDRLRQEASQ